MPFLTKGPRFSQDTCNKNLRKDELGGGGEEGAQKPSLVTSIKKQTHDQFTGALLHIV